MNSRTIAAAVCVTFLALDAGAATGDLKHPDWHPNGRSLIAEGSCFGSIDLFVINLDDRSVRQLWDGGFDEGYPRWFPNGTSVVFHQFDDERRARIFVGTVNTRGEIDKARRLTDGPFDIEPAPSPVGQTIAFSHPGENGLDIALVDLATRKVIRSWKTEAADNFPSWFPDGNSIVFHARDNDGTQIYRRDLKTNKLSQLTTGKSPNMVANISTDGDMLAYSSERDHDREIYIRDLASGKDVRQTSRAGRDGYPKFSPDNRKLAYHAVTDNGQTVVRILNIDNRYVTEFNCDQVASD